MITSCDCNVLSLPFLKMNVVCTIAQVWCVEALLLETASIRPLQNNARCHVHSILNLAAVAKIYGTSPQVFARSP